MSPQFPSLGDRPTYPVVTPHSSTSAVLDQYNRLHSGHNYMVGVVGAGNPYLPYFSPGHYNNLNHKKSPIRLVSY